MADKFAIFKIPNGFLQPSENIDNLDPFELTGSTLFTEDLAEEAGLKGDNLIRIPVTAQMQASVEKETGIAFDDAAPEVTNTTMAMTTADFGGLLPDVDFVALSTSGFTDVMPKYSEAEFDESKLTTHGFALQDATAFNSDTYVDVMLHTKDSLDADATLIPISKSQMQALSKIPEFTTEFGFLFDGEREIPELSIMPGVYEDGANTLNLDGLTEEQDDTLQQ